MYSVVASQHEMRGERNHDVPLVRFCWVTALGPRVSFQLVQLRGRAPHRNCAFVFSVGGPFGPCDRDRDRAMELRDHRTCKLVR